VASRPVVTVTGSVTTGSPLDPASPTGRATLVRPVRRSRDLRKKLELVLLLGPALVLFAGFVLVPIGIAVQYSLYNWSGMTSLTDFIGLHNYREALDDPVFRGAILHNFLFAALSIIFQLPLTLGTALLLNRKLRGQRVFRVLTFAPYVLSEATTAVIWLLMLQPGGFVDVLMHDVGLGGLVQTWLANLNIVLYTLFVVITWKYIGFGIILFLAGLQGIPVELKEAAALDGASSAQSTRHVVLPLLGPTIRIWIFLAVIGSLQLFDLVWIMTEGGPANASTTMITYLIYNGFDSAEFGYGSAVAVILFVICFLFAILYQRFALRRDTAGALTSMVG
jgi:raffinose/stachyose/melibiose transport system permease protein